MKPTDAECAMDALAAQAIRRSTEQPEGTPERAAAERVAFEMVRAAGIAGAGGRVDWRKRVEERAKNS